MRLELWTYLNFFLGLIEVIGYNRRIVFGSLNRKKGASVHE